MWRVAFATGMKRVAFVLVCVAAFLAGLAFGLTDDGNRRTVETVRVDQ